MGRVKFVSITDPKTRSEISIEKDKAGMFFVCLDGVPFFADWDYEKVRSVLW